MLNLFLCRQLLFNFLQPNIIISCNSHRRLNPLKCPLNFCLFFIFANQQSDCGIFVWSPNQFIHSIYIKIQFPGKFRFKGNCLQLNYNIAFETNMTKQNIPIIPISE